MFGDEVVTHSKATNSLRSPQATCVATVITTLCYSTNSYATLIMDRPSSLIRPRVGDSGTVGREVV